MISRAIALELLRVGRLLGRKHRELVAAHARDDALGPDALDQARAQLAQQLVAVVVAQRVVDLLEAVQVQQHHRKRLAGAAGASQLVLELGAEALAVGEAGQLVGVGDALELLAAALGGEQLADQVLEQDDHQAERR